MRYIFSNIVCIPMVAVENTVGCPCVSCEAGEGALLCLDCHYRYATINGEHLCHKCSRENFYATMEAEAKAEVDARGLRYGVENAWDKFQAEVEYV